MHDICKHNIITTTRRKSFVWWPFTKEMDNETIPFNCEIAHILLSKWTEPTTLFVPLYLADHFEGQEKRRRERQSTTSPYAMGRHGKRFFQINEQFLFVCIIMWTRYLYIRLLSIRKWDEVYTKKMNSSDSSYSHAWPATQRKQRRSLLPEFTSFIRQKLKLFWLLLLCVSVLCELCAPYFVHQSE